MGNAAYDRVPTEHLARSAGVIAFAAVAVIHVLDPPDTRPDMPRRSLRAAAYRASLSALPKITISADLSQ